MGRGQQSTPSSAVLYGKPTPRRRHHRAVHKQSKGLDNRLVSGWELGKHQIKELGSSLFLWSQVTGQGTDNLKVTIKMLSEALKLKEPAGSLTTLEDWLTATTQITKRSTLPRVVSLSSAAWADVLEALHFCSQAKGWIAPALITSRAGLYDFMRGGVEAEDHDKPVACSWPECDAPLAPISEMHYYHGSGITGFLCDDCAEQQILSDKGLL